jgi:hypothetical protein
VAKGMAASMLKRHKKKTETIDLGSKGNIKIQKGGLHRSLGIPEGQKIPAGKLDEAAGEGGKVGKQARLALAMKGWKK